MKNNQNVFPRINKRIKKNVLDIGPCGSVVAIKTCFTSTRDWCMFGTNFIHQNGAMEDSILKTHADHKFLKYFSKFA